jgi:hypothetical protein
MPWVGSMHQLPMQQSMPGQLTTHYQAHWSCVIARIVTIGTCMMLAFFIALARLCICVCGNSCCACACWAFMSAVQARYKCMLHVGSAKWHFSAWDVSKLSIIAMNAERNVLGFRVHFV